IRRMVQHHFDDDANPTLVRGVQKSLEVVQCAVGGVDGTIFRDVISIIAQWRRKEGHQPDSIDSEILEVIQFLRKPAKITDSVAAAVVESTDVNLIDNGILVPEHVLRENQGLTSSGDFRRCPYQRTEVRFYVN